MMEDAVSVPVKSRLETQLPAYTAEKSSFSRTNLPGETNPLHRLWKPGFFNPLHRLLKPGFLFT